MFKGKTIVLGVTGGIAAYKAASLCSYLAQQHADVHVIMTENATKLITPLTFQALSKNHVCVGTFEENNTAVINHIHYADIADLIVVAPATANTIAKIANGLADDMLSNVILATTKKVLICPAMNVNMLNQPVTQRNMEILKKDGKEILNPSSGYLACGYEADGKLPDTRDIVEKIKSLILKV